MDIGILDQGVQDVRNELLKTVEEVVQKTEMGVAECVK